MDNKLSELSKPVHIFKHPHGQAFWCVVSNNMGGTKDVHAYYSQEYVSALLAELEAKDKRIAELERITEGVDQLAIDGSWTARGMSEYAKSLEAKLATPVRLSDTTHPRCRLQHAEDIRAAGFKCVGDE